MRRVVVTGLGCVSPLGNSVEETWAGVKAGKCGIATTTKYDVGPFKVKYSAEVKNFKAEDYMDSASARKMAPFTQFAVAAAKQALDDSGLMGKQDILDDTAVYLGVGIGGLDVTEASMKSYISSEMTRVPPMTIPELIPNEAAANVSLQFGLHGATHTVATACASGTDAIGNALDVIRSGRYDVILAGGAESTICGFGTLSFTVLHALSSKWADDPSKACRPFDKDRDGFIMGEGATILVLEEYEHAKARGAKIYAEVAGYGASSDAYHITAPREDGSGGVLAMKRAFEDAGMKPSEVQYYNAHGTSTSANDSAETAMIKSVFGEDAKKLHISSTKSEIGHMVGAAGAIEAIMCIKAMEENFIPPTINLDNPDLEHGCDLDYTPNKGVACEINASASCSLGFGGHNGCIILRKI